MKITFHGGAGEVTGSCYLVEAGGQRFLVDCGLFQGGRDAESKNRRALAFDLARLDFVLITHAHIDHSGLLPRLTALGFRGPVYTTPATADLLAVLLPDAAHIQEKEAEWENWARRERRSRARSAALPLYTVTQAQACLRQLRRVHYEEEFEPLPGVHCRFHDAGHILGSASIECRVDDGGRTATLVFSGDLGQPGAPIVRDPTLVEHADVLLVESTYGDRLHRSRDETLDELVHAITDTLERKGGNVVIPAFSVGRTQDLLFLLHDLCRKGRLPPLDIYVDSPMATSATEITFRHMELLDDETRGMVAWLRKGGRVPRVHFVDSLEESMALNARRGGAVIISASGMCEAGRIKHHLKFNLGRRECTVVITGFQAAGTLGRRLVDGARVVRIFGNDVPVRADVYTIGGLSAHADQAALLGWLRGFRSPPRKTFVVHGEPAAAQALATLIRAQRGWAVEVPKRGDVASL